MDDIVKEYWELLHLFEDYLTDGYRRNHATPELLMPGRRKAASASSRVPQGQHERPPVASTADREEALAELSREIATCTRCGLHRNRTFAVPGHGTLDPLVMFIGEGPGYEEDRQGIPFVGRAGQYLDKWLQAIGLSRDENCFIGNIVKCRPPENRDPAPDEIEACLPYLERQIALIRPKTLCTLGRVASQVLIGTETGITALRGKIYMFREIPLVPTYHPSGVLRNQQLRRAVWEDLKQLKQQV
jgi:DNA polymerase